MREAKVEKKLKYKVLIVEKNERKQQRVQDLLIYGFNFEPKFVEAFGTSSGALRAILYSQFGADQ